MAAELCQILRQIIRDILLSLSSWFSNASNLIPWEVHSNSRDDVCNVRIY
jgi:hypothetical protein